MNYVNLVVLIFYSFYTYIILVFIIIIVFYHYSFDLIFEYSFCIFYFCFVVSFDQSIFFLLFLPQLEYFVLLRYWGIIVNVGLIF